MLDGFGRSIDYLRISVTDRCNLRCRYCMPEEGVEWLPHDQILRFEDILRLSRSFARLGVRRVRLTGGEPLVRRGLPELVAGLRAIPGIREVALTTNGILLSQQLPALLEAGLTGVNLSLDTLNEDTFRRITFAMSDAQSYRNVTWVVGDAGCGKTTAAIEYRRTHRNVFYILCSEDMKKSDFVREIAKQVGAPVDGTNLRDILEYAISLIAYLQTPLLIFDEGDKLTDSVFNYFISIYNRLEGKAGIIFLSTDYIKRRLENGLRYNKKGYKEINSRIGRKFFDVSVATEQDVYAICQANGLTDPSDVRRVVREAMQGEYDLRRVKRVVHACKRIGEARRQKEGGEV